MVRLVGAVIADCWFDRVLGHGGVSSRAVTFANGWCGRGHERGGVLCCAAVSANCWCIIDRWHGGSELLSLTAGVIAFMGIYSGEAHQSCCR